MAARPHARPNFSPLAEYPRSCRSHVPRRAIPCSELAQQRHNIIRNRVTLVAEESVSVEPAPPRRLNQENPHVEARRDLVDDSTLLPF